MPRHSPLASQSWNDAKGPFRVVFDAVPTPLLVVNHDVAILALNRVATTLFGPNPGAVLSRRGGDALGCVHHLEAPRGCGHASACRTCLIRGSVTGAMKGNEVRRQLTRMDLKTASGTVPIHVRVTAAPFELVEHLVLLAIEDVSELIQLEALLPICSWCKKVRTGEKYWEAVDTFLTRKLSVDFSHSICEECLEKQYPDDDTAQDHPRD